MSHDLLLQPEVQNVFQNSLQRNLQRINAQITTPGLLYILNAGK